MMELWLHRSHETAASTEVWRHEAATVKATTPVSVADAWICGLARLLDAVPDLKGPQFPYKHKTR